MVTLNVIEETLLKRTRHPSDGALLAKTHSIQIFVITGRLTNLMSRTLCVARESKQNRLRDNSSIFQKELTEIQACSTDKDTVLAKQGHIKITPFSYW